jgi:hypothetical protein
MEKRGEGLVFGPCVPMRWGEGGKPGMRIRLGGRWRLVGSEGPFQPPAQQAEAEEAEAANWEACGQPFFRAIYHLQQSEECGK